MNHRSPALLLALLCLVAWQVTLAPAATPATATEPGGVWPLDPEPSVVAGFAPPTDPWRPGHRGVDLAGAAGQVVHSALAGEVGFVGSIAGKPVVTILHGGRRTTYEPVVGTVAAGDEVRAGDPIGRLVVVASHCFPDACLHWGLRSGEVYLDPLDLVGGGPVRLLPLWRERPAALGDGPGTLWAPPLVGWQPLLDLLLRRVDAPGGRPGGADRW